jgi:hypothetical protein
MVTGRHGPPKFGAVLYEKRSISPITLSPDA